MLFQYDTNRYLIVAVECNEIHFANGVYEKTLDVKVENGKALIPDVLLQYGYPLVAYAYVGSELDGYTKIEKSFKVNKRPKPSDYVFTPTEQLTLQGLKEKLEKVEDAISEEVEDYFEKNPIEFTEEDPTVPEWAKQEVKPIYTAEEVGARDKDWLPSPEEIGAQVKGDYALKSELPTIPATDKTLTIDGRPADAKAVGEKLKEQDEKIDDIGISIESFDKKLEGKQPVGDYALKSELLKLDKTLSVEGSAADAKSTGKAITQIQAQIETEKLELQQQIETRQPKGNYALKSEIPEVPDSIVTSINGKSGDVSISAASIGAVSESELKESVENALTEAKESGEFDGPPGDPGKNGISATHQWEGTVLTMTSASGASSADLKGESGEDGGYYTPNVNDEGLLSWQPSKEDMPAVPPAHVKGPAGYTPVKGTDYWTASDKAEIVSDVLSALPTWNGGVY